MDSADYEELQRERREELRAAVADRSPHAAFLKTLEDGGRGKIWEIPRPTGLGGTIAGALRMDLEWCLRPPVLTESGEVDPGDSRNHYEHAYERVRTAYARRAQSRREAKRQSGPDILKGLLQL